MEFPPALQACGTGFFDSPHFMRFLFGIVFRQPLFFRRNTKKDVCAAPPQGPAFNRGIVAHLPFLLPQEKKTTPSTFKSSSLYFRGLPRKSAPKNKGWEGRL